MISVQLFVISLCATLGFCKIITPITLIKNCPPGNENRPKDGNQIKLLKFKLQGCPSDRDTCTLIKGDMMIGEIRARFNYTAKALFMTMKADTKLLGTITLANKKNVCGYAEEGSCKRIKPRYTMTFEFEEKMDKWTPSFDGIVTTIGTDEDGTIRYCGQAHVIVKSDGSSDVVEKVVGSIIG